MRKNYKRCALGRIGKFAHARARAKGLTVTESLEIAREPQSGEMTKMGSDHVQKFEPVSWREHQYICEHARELNI